MELSIPEDVGPLLRDLRVRRGMTQATVACLARVARPSVVEFETGYKIPSLAVLLRLLTVLGVRVELSDVPVSECPAPSLVDV